MAFAVIVQFKIKPGQIDDFLPLMRANAETSLAVEPGCVRFDVLTDPDRPDEVRLYEIYETNEAFAVHLQSDHFLRFDSAVTDMIAEKDVETWREVWS